MFKLGRFTYFLGISNELLSSKADTNDRTISRIQHLRQLGEMARVLTDAGLILITSISDIDDYELNMLKALNRPNKTVVVNVGQNRFSGEEIDLSLEKGEEAGAAADKIIRLLVKLVLLDPEFSI